MELATYIKKMREEKGLTQGEVADRLGYTNGQFISNWENSRSYPPPPTLKKLCKVLSLDKQKVFNLSIKRQQELLRKALAL